MKTPAIISYLAGIILLALTPTLLRAQSGTYQNLTVTGSTGSLSGTLIVSGTASIVDFQGPSMMLGASGANAGLTLSYSTSGSAGTVDFVGTGTSMVWQWSRFNGSGSPLIMTLDAASKLNLYNTSGSAAIVMDPINGKITINGQTIGGGSGVWNTSGGNTILSTGSVGIGTSSPAFSLDVSGTIGNGASGGYINLNDSNNGISIIPGGSKPITFADNILSSDGDFSIKSGSARFSALVDSSGAISMSPSSRILYTPSGSNAIRFDDAGADSLPFTTAITGAGNRWPVIFSGTANDNNIMISNTSSGNYLYMGFREGADAAMLGSNHGIVQIEASGTAGLVMDGGNGVFGGLNTSVNYFGSYGGGAGSDADVAFFTQANKGGSIINERMRIQGGTGYVGINTSSPVALLDVEGSGRFTGPVHLEPQGDLDMGEFTYDPDSGDGDGEGGDSMRGGGGFGMGMGAGSGSSSGTGGSGTSSGTSGH